MITTNTLLTHLNECMTVGDLDALETKDLQQMTNVLQHWAYQAEKRLLERRPVSRADHIDTIPWWLSLE